MKERNYEALVAGMRKVQTITDAEEVIRTQPKIQLPDRRSITLWNSPELGQFRGVQESIDGKEDARHTAAVQRLEAQRAARAGNVPAVDVNFVQQAAAGQQRREPPMQTHREDLDAVHRQQQRGMAEEAKAAMDKLLTHTAEHANRARVAEQVNAGFQYKMDAHMDYMRAQAAQVAPPTVIDARVTNNNTNNSVTMEDRTNHNRMMDFMAANVQGLASAAAAQQQTVAQMEANVTRLMGQKLPDPVTVVSGGGGPQPPPDAGGAVAGKLFNIPSWPHRAHPGSEGYAQPVQSGGYTDPPGPPAPMIPSVVPKMVFTGGPAAGAPSAPSATQFFSMDTPRPAAGVKKNTKETLAKRPLMPTSKLA